MDFICFVFMLTDILGWEEYKKILWLKCDAATHIQSLSKYTQIKLQILQYTSI